MIIYAVNIHTGGGKVLLDELLINEPLGKITALFHDNRYVVPDVAKNKFYCYNTPPRLFSRMMAEFKLLRHLKLHGDQFVLFFGNMPPVFISPPQSALYLQNCFLLPNVRVETDSLKTLLRLLVEKWLLKWRIHHVSEIWVQTNWMAEGLSSFKNLQVKKRPFLPSLPPPSYHDKQYDFITVTSLAKHKNLKQLIEALQIIENHSNRKLSVLIVLDNTNSLAENEFSHFSNIKVTLLTNVQRSDLLDLYQKSRCSIITSKAESFSLPIYESLHFKLRVICPALGYISEIQDRVISYNPNSAQDLAEKMLAEVSNFS